MSEAVETVAAADQAVAVGKVAYKRRMIGRVASDKMAKTVVVEVVRYKMDRMYKKYVKVRRRYQAHDESNEYNTGDRVEIMEHRPISKHKRWKVVRLIERAPIA